MRRLVLLLPVMLAGMALSGCETVGYDDGPAEYALRPDYRDVYRRPPPRVYERYDRYDEIYHRPPPRYRPYGRPGGYYDRYERYDRY